MANVRISQLPEYTGNTTGVYLVMNNSGETITYKVKKETLSAGTSGTSGTSGSSGSNGSSGTSGSSGSNGSSGDSLFALTGSVWNTTNNLGITGSLTMTGSLTVTSNTGSVTTFKNSNNSGSFQLTHGDFSTTLKINNQKPGVGESVLRLEKSNGVYPGVTYNAIFLLKESGSFKLQDTLESSTSSFSTQDIFVIKDNPSGSATLSPFEIKRNTQITGSLTVTGSSTLNAGLIGNNVLTASLNSIDSSGVGNYIIAKNGSNFIEAGINQLSGSTFNRIIGPTQITGSLTVSGSAHKIVGNTQITGSLTVKATPSTGVGTINLFDTQNSSSIRSNVTYYSSELSINTTHSGSAGESIIKLQSYEPTGSRYNGVSFYQQSGSFIMYEEMPGSGGGISYSPVLILKNSVDPSPISTLEIPRNTSITGSLTVSDIPSGSASNEVVVFNTSTNKLERKTNASSSGTSGTSGTSGGTGSSGTSGSSGSSGTSGSSGSSGTSGSSGSSGTSGSSGSSGTSGSSGVSPSVSEFITTGSISTTQSITGSLIISGSIIQTGSVQGNVFPLSISSNTASLNLDNGNFFTLQLVSGSATHLNPSNIKPGQTVSVFVNTIDYATMTFPSSIKQISGSAYVPTTTTGIDILTLISKDTSSLFLVNTKNLV